MKKLLAILLAVAMLLTFTACGDDTAKDTATTKSTAAATTAGTTVAPEAEATTTTANAADTTVTTEGEITTATEAETTTAATTTATQAPTTSATKAPTTTATKAPTTTATTAAPKNPGNVPKSISILSVGNSFSVDAMKNHLYPMLEAAGCTDIRLGILYIGGCSIDKHYECVRRDTASYEYYENVNGEWVITPEYKASAAFALTDWDIVTLQQASPDSGRPISYENLGALIDLIRPQIGDAELYWHMTWAYQQDSDHSAFGNYNKDQMRMYKGIVDATKRRIVGNEAFVGYFPVGTAIQNLRTSSLGDTLTADGYHLKDTYGDYTAALTWFCYLTGADAETVAYRPASIEDHFDEIAESVNNALATPLAVTECK